MKLGYYKCDPLSFFLAYHVSSPPPQRVPLNSGQTIQFKMTCDKMVKKTPLRARLETWLKRGNFQVQCIRCCNRYGALAQKHLMHKHSAESMQAGMQIYHRTSHTISLKVNKAVPHNLRGDIPCEGSIQLFPKLSEWQLSNLNYNILPGLAVFSGSWTKHLFHSIMSQEHLHSSFWQSV